jgi:hypothetical protein
MYTIVLYDVPCRRKLITSELHVKWGLYWIDKGWNEIRPTAFSVELNPIPKFHWNPWNSFGYETCRCRDSARPHHYGFILYII